MRFSLSLSLCFAVQIARSKFTMMMMEKKHTKRNVERRVSERWPSLLRFQSATHIIYVKNNSGSRVHHLFDTIAMYLHTLTSSVLVFIKCVAHRMMNINHELKRIQQMNKSKKTTALTKITRLRSMKQKHTKKWFTVAANYSRQHISDQQHTHIVPIELDQSDIQ